jgi:hypothetical protein
MNDMIEDIINAMMPPINNELISWEYSYE